MLHDESLEFELNDGEMVQLRQYSVFESLFAPGHLQGQGFISLTLDAEQRVVVSDWSVAILRCGSTGVNRVSRGVVIVLGKSVVATDLLYADGIHHK